MDFASKILEMLAGGEGLTTAQVAEELGVDRKEVNAAVFQCLERNFPTIGNLAGGFSNGAEEPKIGMLYSPEAVTLCY